MSDRYKAITVIFTEAVSEDMLGVYVTALKCFHGVAVVEPIKETPVEDLMVRWKVLDEVRELFLKEMRKLRDGK